MGHGKESWVEASHLFDLRNVCEIFGGPVIKGAYWRGPVSPRSGLPQHPSRGVASGDSATMGFRRHVSLL